MRSHNTMSYSAPLATCQPLNNIQTVCFDA